MSCMAFWGYIFFLRTSKECLIFFQPQNTPPSRIKEPKWASHLSSLSTQRKKMQTAFSSTTQSVREEIESSNTTTTTGLIFCRKKILPNRRRPINKSSLNISTFFACLGLFNEEVYVELEATGPIL